MDESLITLVIVSVPDRNMIKACFILFDNIKGQQSEFPVDFSCHCYITIDMTLSLGLYVMINEIII